MRDYSEDTYHGFCVYTSIYYMTDVDDFNVIEITLTMKSIIDFYLKELELF